MTDQRPSDYMEALHAQELRGQIHTLAKAAVQHGGVDLGWANTALNKIGAPLITDVPATYRINAPIVGALGATVTAHNRAEALAKFNALAQAAIDRGVVAGVVRVFNPEIVDDGIGPKFFSGPEDIDSAEAADDMPIDLLRRAIRAMLMQGVAEQGWGYGYAVQAAEVMGLEPLPALTVETVQVPVSGVHQMNVQVFEGADDDTVQAAVKKQLGNGRSVPVKPEEVGDARWNRPSASEDAAGLGFRLIDEDDDA